MRKLFSTLTAIVMVAFIVDSASATDRTWVGGAGMNGNWNSDSNWGGTQPSSSDKVIFPSNSGTPYVVTVNTVEACQFMDVHADCKIDIVTSGRLEVGSADGQTSDIDGYIQLSNSGSTLRFMANHTLRPKTNNGSNVFVIDGQHDDAVVDDNTTGQKTLTLSSNGTAQARVAGAFQFQNLALANNTLIDADVGNGTLRLTSGVTYSGSGSFAVGPPSGTNYATLRFDIALSSTFDFANLMTIRAYGTLDFGANQCFTVNRPTGTSPYRIHAQSGVTANFKKASCP